MHGKGSKRSRALWARGFIVLGAVLGLGFGARPAAAGPFAYVVNSPDSTVSVIDTATNTVVATVPVGAGPDEVAITPDGKHAYVTNVDSNTVLVIDTATNTVVATVPMGCFPTSNAVPRTTCFPVGVAVTPDGKHAYVTNSNLTIFATGVAVTPDGKHPNRNGAVTGPGTFSVIDTATNTVVGTPIPVGTQPLAVAVTPDGRHAYVVNGISDNVSVIDTATNTVVATVPVEVSPLGVAVTPDGKHAYVGSFFSVSVIATASNTVVATVPVRSLGVAITPDGQHAYVPNGGSETGAGVVSVIATASNTVVATIAFPVGSFPTGVAVSPDGKHAYVTNTGANTVAVIDTASNTVIATVPVGNGPRSVGIIPDIPFAAFRAKLAIQFGKMPNQNGFVLQSGFILGSASRAIYPPAVPVTLQIGTFATTIPPGSFTGAKYGPYIFRGVINGVTLKVLIYPTGAKRYALAAAAQYANLTGTVNPVTVRVSIGVDSGTTPVKADIVTALVTAH